MEQTRRLFVGIVLPPDVVRVLRRRQRTLAARYEGLPVHWTPLTNLHVTVSFLGHVADARLPEVIAALTRAVREHAPFSVHFDRWMVAPSDAQPKMVWLATSAPSAPLGALKTAVERVVAPQHPAIRPYRPHVTLGRIAQKRWRALPEKPAIAAPAALPVAVDAVTLFESAVVDGKRTYVPLATCPLEG